MPTTGTHTTNLASDMPTTGTRRTNVASDMPTTGTRRTNVASDMPTNGTRTTTVPSEMPTTGTRTTNVASDVPTTGTRTTHMTSNATGPMAANAGAVSGGQGTAANSVFEDAPWEPHHESTLSALTHAKQVGHCFSYGNLLRGLGFAITPARQLVIDLHQRNAFYMSPRVIWRHVTPNLSCNSTFLESFPLAVNDACINLPLSGALQAHIKAVQAQRELQAATQAKQDAEMAEQRRLEVTHPVPASLPACSMTQSGTCGCSSKVELQTYVLVWAAA